VLENIWTLRAHLSDINIRIFEFRWLQMDYKKNKNQWKCDVKTLESKRKGDCRLMMCLGSLWQNIPGEWKLLIKSTHAVELKFYLRKIIRFPLEIALLFIVLIHHVSRTFGHKTCVCEHALTVIITVVTRGTSFHYKDINTVLVICYDYESFVCILLGRF